MTRDQVAQIVKHNLDDAGVYYSDSDINESLQDAYDEIAVFTEFIERTIEISLQADTNYYNLSLLIPDYYRLVYIYNIGKKQFIYPDVERKISGYRADWELAYQTETNFTINGPKYIGIFGRTAFVEPNAKLKIWYKATAPIMQGNSIILINTNYIQLLENYSTADLLEQNQEFTKALEYWQTYEVDLLKYREKIQLLSKKDRVFSRPTSTVYARW